MFLSAGMPVLLILVIQGSIWINFSIPAVLNQPLFFMRYLVVSFIQMGANIDYAIVIASRYQKLKNTMSHRDAMIETLNFAFPTVITSGTILAVAGTLIGQSLGRGTIISMLFVLFVLPQILLLGGIVGQMVPDITLRFSSGGLDELQIELNALQSLINRTLDDAQSASDSVTGGVSRIAEQRRGALRPADRLRGRERLVVE